MSRLWAFPMLALASIVVACSQSADGANTAPVHDFPGSTVWSGITSSGLKIVVEPIAETVHAQPAIASEDALLRKTLGIQDGEQLLRVSLHPGAESELPAKRGSVQTGSDVYQPLTTMPEGLSVQGRLLWNSVATGGRDMVASPGQLEHWSFLLVATASALPNPQDKMSWQSESLRVDLESQVWSEAERKQFLDEAPPVEDE